jgi:hypothetical protein
MTGVAILSCPKIRSGAETVSDLLDRFLEHCEATGKSATTMMGYRKIASRTLGPAIGDIKLVKLTVPWHPPLPR